MAIPLNIRLNRKNHRGITLLDHAADMLGELANWLPDHDFRLVGDGAYAPLVGRLPARVTRVSRLRADAALYVDKIYGVDGSQAVIRYEA